MKKPPGEAGASRPTVLAASDIDARRARSTELYASGLSTPQIAAELGVSTATIRNDLIALGIDRRSTVPPDLDDRRARATDLYGRGLTMDQVAAELGVSSATVRNYLAALGVDRRPVLVPNPVSQARLLERSHRVADLYAEGRSLGEIADLTGRDREAIRQDLIRVGVERRSRETSLSGRADGRVFLAAAARQAGVNLDSLRRAAEAGRVRAERVDGGRSPAPGHSRFLFDLDELAADLARLPRCGYPGCDRPALSPSGGCDRQGHAPAVYRFGTSATVRERLLAAAGGCGSPTCTSPSCTVEPGRCHRAGCARPARRARQTKESIRWVYGHPTLYCSRSCAMAADNARFWNTAEGRDLRRIRMNPITAKRMHGKAAARRPGAGRPAVVVPDDQRARVAELARRGLGRGSIARATGLTERVVRRLLESS